MPTGKLRKARISDAPKIQALIMYYAERKEMLPRSLNEIYENIRDFVVIENGGAIIGCSCLHVCWEDLVEIKSLAVAPEHVRKGCGSQLVRFELDEAGTLGVRTVFALTFKPAFFERHGFRRIDRNSLPKKVWSECINCFMFPDCGETAVVCDLQSSSAKNG